MTQSGFSIIAAIVAFFLVTLAAIGLSRAFSNYSGSSARIEHSIKGDQVLVRTAARVQELGYGRLLDLCNGEEALPGPAPEKCVAGGGINPALTFDPSKVSDASLQIPRDFEGAPLKGGPVCVELRQCGLRAAGHLLEMTLQGYWKDPRLGMQSRLFTIRRTRW